MKRVQKEVKSITVYLPLVYEKQYVYVAQKGLKKWFIKWAHSTTAAGYDRIKNKNENA